MSINLTNLNLQNCIENLPGLVWIKDINLRYAASNKQFNQFIGSSRNECHLNKLTIPFSIVRWDECLQWPSFQQCVELVTHYFENDAIYFDAYQEDANMFGKKRMTSN